MFNIDRIRVDSESEINKSYVVTFVGTTAVACTCPSFHYRSVGDQDFSCKHMLGTRAHTNAALSVDEINKLRKLLAALDA